MILRLFSPRNNRKIAWTLLTLMAVQGFAPNKAQALTSGPVQPEAQGFEPVGTTDMVDPFTGDFVYNIPLMDVEGYPINISYHGGVGMEQEASWCGLGWNITPGAVNRALRGLPDEFNGDTVEKQFYVKPDITKKIGLNVAAELFGVGEPRKFSVGANLGGYLTMSNYRGVSVDFTTGAGVNMNIGMISGGINTGATIGSQTGGSIDYGAYIGVGTSKKQSEDLGAGGSFNLNYGGNYSPRTGLRQSVGFGVSLSKVDYNGRDKNTSSVSTGATVPIGLLNHTAAVTNASYMNSYAGALKAGGEVFGVYGNVKVNGSYTKTEVKQNGSRKGYGYFNLQNSDDESLLDFSREKDGMFNGTMSFLPQSHLTYDVYSVSGQGTGGSFRPIRNDVGAVFDPKTESEQNTESGSIEFGFGNLFEVGGEIKTGETSTKSGPWQDYKREFPLKQSGPTVLGPTEHVYFKEAGELTENNETYLNGFGNTAILEPKDVQNIPKIKPAANKRIIRANHIYARNGSLWDTAALLSSQKIISYTDTTGFSTYPIVNKELISRVGASFPSKNLGRKTNQLTEIVQTQKDGRRYVYGLPVLNNIQREATFAIPSLNNNASALSTYLADYTADDDKPGNSNGIDNFYSATTTPSYVTAHLLTSVLSADYSDVTGDGISDDDLGSYTKFNYSRKSSDYRWRSPSQSGKAQYVPGYITDKKDDKASYMIGSREQWMLHSIVTKNYVAEFYVSRRLDAQGVTDSITKSSGFVYNNKYNTLASADSQYSYKLDSVVLFNKHDRFTNGLKAQPIKSVIFTYDYSLCPGVPNATGNAGKLTLKKIQIRYGSSNLNMSAAYSFSYSNNFPYNSAAKDRWGSYKPNNLQFNNYEFPFTEQTTNSDDYAKAWSLSSITLPSGGVIAVDYESDDYAYVQDKEAMEMFMVQGVGNSATYTDGDQLYFSPFQPNLYYFFKRRKAAENRNISFADNYLKGTNLVYYNVPVELADGKFEPIKGYAEIDKVDSCTGSQSDYGYIRMKARDLVGYSGAKASPVVYTALNVGRSSLQHIMFPGSDPDGTDMGNITAGLKNAIRELFLIAQNPLKNYMNEGKAKDADLKKAFIRLTSPGLAKKGGGQRVKSVKFYDNWAAMTGGNEAVYGKVYNYTMLREDGKGVISSGVASWEPISGGDEIPQHVPKSYTAQQGGNNIFPVNDPIEMYQEMPIGESFFPSPVVGYRKVTSRSINQDKGRSSQSEDINYFYTAKDFPIWTDNSTIARNNDRMPKIKIDEVEVKEEFKQGFAIKLNDMHGKPMNTEHWILKPDTVTKARELVSAQKNEYFTQAGQLSNMVPAYVHDPATGQMNVIDKKMGIETDITIDSRVRDEVSKTWDISASVNGMLITAFPVIIPMILPFPYGSHINFKAATVTKVTQQYGILSKVISNNQGATTELRNEVFDPQTGNALVTSVNNEFGDRQYSSSYPAYWAYKELGPSYENQNQWDAFSNPIIIDSFGLYAKRFVNYNPSYSSHYDLPSNMPVGRTIVDEQMPKYKLGDEMLLYVPFMPQLQPVRVWVMGYTSDIDHCYAVLATREPYEAESFWALGTTLATNQIVYRVVRSGNRNRLGETIQSYTTTDRSNVMPYAKNDLNGLINFSATRYNHVQNQVYAANVVSDSLNPFVTGKVGTYRQQMEVVNLKKRDYVGGTTRTAGTFGSTAYWKVEKDNYLNYCPDSVLSACPAIVQSFQLTYMPGNKIRIDVVPISGTGGPQAFFSIGANVSGMQGTYYSLPTSAPQTFTYTIPNGVNILQTGLGIGVFNGCCRGTFSVTFDGQHFYITGWSDGDPCNNNPGNIPISAVDIYNPSLLGNGIGVALSPFRIKNKILLGKVGHYDGTDNENWIKASEVTKYNWHGAEIENKEEGLGYNAAVYGYNQQLPVCVAKNARHNEVLFEGFEDYALLRANPSKREEYMKLFYSPVAPYMQSATAIGTTYKKSTLQAAGLPFIITSDDAHTGIYAMKATGNIVLPMNAAGSGMASGYSFRMKDSCRYVASLWMKPVTAPSGNAITTGYNGTASITADTSANAASSMLITAQLLPKTNIIEGWQQYEVTFTVPAGYKNFKLNLGGGFYYDDMRVYPFVSNSKGFVYDPVTRKLMATLDENNYATFYEYDAEGNLVRTKKETENGILTISETRSTHRK